MYLKSGLKCRIEMLTSWYMRQKTLTASLVRDQITFIQTRLMVSSS